MIGINQERVEQPDKKDPRVGIGACVGNEALVDVESRGVRQKAEACGDTLRLQVLTGIGDDLVGYPDQHGDENELEDEASPPCPTTERPLQRE